MGTIQIDLNLNGREELSLHLEMDAREHITKAKLHGIGGPEFLSMLAEVRATLTGPLAKVPLPKGHSTAAMMMREALLRARGLWHPPYEEEELCHCRGVSTKRVQEAILIGAHTSRKVSEMTSASTNCGSCRPNVEALIAYRLADDEESAEAAKGA